MRHYYIEALVSPIYTWVGSEIVKDLALFESVRPMRAKDKALLDYFHGRWKELTGESIEQSRAKGYTHIEDLALRISTPSVDMEQAERQWNNVRRHILQHGVQDTLAWKEHIFRVDEQSEDDLEGAWTYANVIHDWYLGQYTPPDDPSPFSGITEAPSLHAIIRRLIDSFNYGGGRVSTVKMIDAALWYYSANGRIPDFEELPHHTVHGEIVDPEYFINEITPNQGDGITIGQRLEAVFDDPRRRNAFLADLYRIGSRTWDEFFDYFEGLCSEIGRKNPFANPNSMKASVSASRPLRSRRR